MAKPKGIIHLEGTVGKISFYTCLGKEVARTPGGPSAEQIRTKKSCKRNRENIDEYLHGAVQAGKTFRVSMVAMKHLWHPNLSGMLNKLLRNMMNFSPGVRGQRPVQVFHPKELLKEFLFHPDLSFDRIVCCPYSVAMNGNRNEGVVHVPSFDSVLFVHAPSGATHYRFLFAISVLSEYVFVKSGEKYIASDQEADGQSCVAASGFLEVHSTVPGFSLNASLSPTVVPAASSAVILSLGIEFYQEVSGEKYLLKQKGCMKVVEVY